MKKDVFGLPKQLGDGLVLRWATENDAQDLAAFNRRVHGDPGEDTAFLGHWTADLMGGSHPTTKANDFTVVVDENDKGKIVSSMNLISQTWLYEDIPIAVGRPELVGTDEAYRRRGLVRAQFEAIHAKSAGRGELVQGITGIPWYYRQFGYEMCVNLYGSRIFYWATPGHNKTVPEAEENYRLRPATELDLPLIAELYGRFCEGSLLSRAFMENEVRFELFSAHKDSPGNRQLRIVENTAGEPVGYAAIQDWGGQFTLNELAVRPGHSLRAIGLFITRALKRIAAEKNKSAKTPINRINFTFGDNHPVYEALGPELEKARPPYAWFIRVPDLPAFFHQIAPVLEQRLAKGVMAGFSGNVKFSFYRRQLQLTWVDGHLTAVEEPSLTADFKPDAYFPDLSFLQLIFGHRSLDELDHMFADCYPANAQTGVLLRSLFPRKPSWIVYLS